MYQAGAPVPGAPERLGQQAPACAMSAAGRMTIIIIV